MVRVMGLLKEVGYSGMVMPDHVPTDPSDRDNHQALAFAFGYIIALIQATYTEQGVAQAQAAPLCHSRERPALSEAERAGIHRIESMRNLILSQPPTIQQAHLNPARRIAIRGRNPNMPIRHICPAQTDDSLFTIYQTDFPIVF